MAYDRKVKYLDYMEGGTRVRGAGFVKLEARDGILRMELSVTGLHRTDTFARDVVLCGRDREENCGRIEIAAGRGQFRQQWRNLEDIGGTGIGYGELGGLRIPLGPGREISCRWQSCNEAARQRSYGAGRRAAAETAGVRVAAAGMVDAAGARVADVVGARVADTTAETMAPGREARREAWGMEAQKAPGGMAWDGMPEEAAQKAGFGEEPGRKDAFMQEPNPQKADPDKDGLQLAARFPRSTARQWQEGELQGSSVSMEYAGKEGTQKEAEAVMAKRDDRPMGTGVEWEDHGNGSRRNRVQAGREGVPVDWNSRGARGRSAAGQGGTPAKASGEPDRKPVRLMEDKWQQLWAIYPHIRPFQDAREYLSIGPSDFVLFPEASYKAVNNSFLLHGYYNYHHLLLARVERKGEYCYYIGVPGNFYEREKQVAIMFGFESFECAEEPAQAGDFGYYMMRAEI